MAGSTIQVQSAIFLLYVHWNPDKSHVNCNSSSIRVGLARLPVLSPMGEPNTPLAFWQRDGCHLKQQAGHRKIAVRIGQRTKNPISLVANFAPTLCTYFPKKNRIGIYQIISRGICLVKAKWRHVKMRVNYRYPAKYHP